MLKLIFRIAWTLGLVRKAPVLTEGLCTITKGDPILRKAFPWDPETAGTYYPGGYRQQYGTFEIEMRMDIGMCFWLLQLEKAKVCEIDAMERLSDGKMFVTSHHNKNSNDYFRIGPTELMPSPRLYRMWQRKFHSRSFCDELCKEKHFYGIMWRKHYIVWTIDRWPVAICLNQSRIPRQPMHVLISHADKCDWTQIRITL